MAGTLARFTNLTLAWSQPFIASQLRAITLTPAAQFRTSAVVCAEPLKKKKRIDPIVVKMREERRKRKLEKAIKRLQKNALQLKPILELVPERKLVKEREARTRPLPPSSFEVGEERALLYKEWASDKYQQQLCELRAIDTVTLSCQKALDELRAESEELYQLAIQLDASLIPFCRTGPVQTPPIENFDSPDGEYIDTTKKWQ